MKLTSKTWPLILMSLALLAVVVFGVTAYVNTSNVRVAEQEVAETYNVRAAIERLLSTVYGTESFHRGYLVTGEQQYLDNYQSQLQEIDKSLASIIALVSDQPHQLERLEHLNELVDQKKTILSESLENHQWGEVAGQGHSIVLDSKDGQFRDVHSEMLVHNDQRLKLLEHAAVNRAANTKTLILMGNALAIGLAALAMIAWRKSNIQLEAEQLQREAAASELKAIVESVAEGIVTFGTDLNIRFVNAAAERIYRVKGSKILGTPILNMVAERKRVFVREELTRFVKSREKRFELQDGIALRNDGTEFPREGTVTRAIVDNEEVFTLIFSDVSQQKKLQSMIEQQSQLFDQVYTPIQIYDMDDRVVLWNRESERVFGIREDEAVGKQVVPLIYSAQADEYSALKEELLEKKQIVTEWRMTDKDSKQIVIEHRRVLLCDWEGKPSAQLIVNADISERVETESRNRRAQRLESIGTLAGGVAHDVNNVLSPILMAAKMLKRDGADHQKLADTIIVSAERCSKMIRKLLSFAGGETSTHHSIEIGTIVKETESILAHALPPEIELIVWCDEELHPIKGDPTEISQVLMNLAINARDAMRDGGQLEIRVENTVVDEARAARSQVLESGKFVCVTVSDTGEGISPEIIDKIFDPFFTTKPQDQGTGLGLPMTMGIVRSHNGEIIVYSEPDHGTSFSIFLPAHNVAEVQLDGQQRLDLAGKGQSILLVDDESLILETSQSALELNGYKVITAGGGAEAVSIYQHQGDKIDLVILDVMMPGMDGLQTKDAMREINPIVKVIATSGLRRPGTEGSRMKDVNGFLPKPYSDDQLFVLVAKVLTTK